MANTLEFSEENAFDPLLLMDDLVDSSIDDPDIVSTIDTIDEDIDSDEEADTSSARKISSAARNKVQEQCEDLPPFQLNQETLFRELIDQHQRRLYRFVIKYIDHPDDAADITQQAFVEAARTISSFRGDSKLSTWLFGIAMNMVRNYMRKMIEQDLYELPVLSYQELTQEINIQPLARVEL